MSDVVDVLARLVSIDSVNPAFGGPGEAAVAAFVADWFAGRGFETFRQPVFPGRDNVVAVLPGRDRTRRVLLEAHMDTVTTSGMTIPPFDPVVRDGNLYGRGACDTKGGLAGMMCALDEVARAGTPPPCDVWLAAVVDEEHAFTGVGRLAAGLEAEAAIVAEPTDLRIVTATKGVLRFRIEVRGKAAHTSKPHLGVNAISGAARLIRAIDEMHAALGGVAHPLLGSATGAVSMISGGVQINVVPESCTVAIDRRLLPGERAEAVLDTYRRLIDGLGRDDPAFRAALEPPMLVDEALETPLDKSVVRVARAVAGGMGLDDAPQGVPYGSDASKLSRSGVASIVFGPGSIDHAHGAVEQVAVAAVERARDFYRGFISRFG